jgi:hypothetical protein
MVSETFLFQPKLFHHLCSVSLVTKKLENSIRSDRKPKGSGSTEKYDWRAARIINALADDNTAII